MKKKNVYNLVNEEYKEKFNQMLKKEISEKEWSDYCFEITENLIKENEEIFIRLKHS